MTPEDARSIIDDFEAESVEAYRLAVAASLAARVEPQLVRALRLKLFPETDAGAEADLWFSQLVRSQTPMALEFEPEVLEFLRRDLALEQELLRAAWETLREFHADAPYALQLEDELTYLGLSGESNDALIERRLNSVLKAVSAGQRPGLARWANRALPTLPGKVSRTEAASRLSVVAGVQLRTGPVLTAMPGKGMTEEWLSEITAQQISRVEVGVRLLKNELPEPAPVALWPPPSGAPSGKAAVSTDATPDVVEPELLPMIVEFSYPPVLESEIIEVPDTYRLLLEVSWRDAGGAQRLRQLSLLPGERRRVEVGYGEAAIRTALGDIFTLRPRFDYDFMLLYDLDVSQWARNVVERLERQDWRGKRLRVAASPLETVASLSPDLDKELQETFSLSRKVGYAAYGSRVLTKLEPLRPEPRGQSDWLITFKVADFDTYRYRSGPVIEFGDGHFDDGFRALWTAITGESLPLPQEAARTAEAARAGEPLKVFISYSHKDKKFRDQLVKHLIPLEKEGLITTAGEQEIAGKEWEPESNRDLETADIILLLVSASYAASDYTYSVEMAQAMRRHEAGEARVIPVLLSPINWRSAPFSKLMSLPSGAKPVTQWRRRSKAFADIAEGIRRAAEQIRSERTPASLSTFIPRPPVVGFVTRLDKNGRDMIGRLKEALAPGRSGAPFVVLWGAGGVGKTTLAAESARELLPAYGGRVVWSNAGARADFTLHTLLGDIATQLGAPELLTLSLHAKEQAVRALLASAPTLIVLDDHETIAPDAQQSIESWLRSEPCSMLVTTRQRIEGTQTQLISVHTMSRDEADEFLRRLIEQTSDRGVFSREVRRRVYETAEGNPLLMQWVVGHIDRGRDPNKVLQELRQGEGDAARRVFGNSFNLLDDDGRAALLSLSLFVPGASRPALAEVAGFGQDAARLDAVAAQLARLWLAKPTDQNGRFTVEGLTRELAKSLLSTDARAAEFRQRFVAHFLRYAEAYAKTTPEDFAALEAEKDNILNAMDVAFGLKDWSSVMRLMNAINLDGVNGLLMVHGYWDEAIQRGEQAVAAAQADRNESAVAEFTMNIAIVRQARGEYVEAKELLSQALAAFRNLGDESNFAVALHQLAMVAQNQGEFDEARRLYEESLVTKRKLGNESGIAYTLHQLATLAQAQGEREEARQFHVQSLDIKRKLGDLSGIAATLHELGRITQDEGEMYESSRLYNESLKIQKTLGDQLGIANNLQMLGNLSRQLGELRKARELFEESLTIYRRLGSQNGVAGGLYELGLLTAQRGDKAEAVRLLQESLNIFLRIKSPNAATVQGALATLVGDSSPQ